MVGQQRQILQAVAQRRERDGDDRQPEEEILAEAPLGNLQAQILLGRRHDPQVELDRLGRAHPADLPLVERAQQLGLHVERQIVQLVDEQRAALAHLERAAALVGGAGEGPLLVAE